MIFRSFADLAAYLADADHPLAEHLRERRDRFVVFGSGRKAERKAAKDAAWHRIIDRNRKNFVRGRP